ncbi:MAG: prepilin-type N-terminal cleavage/methylation domain-containing protein [Candidatus Saccharibacteria bacterium]|nr:prepilin-type N-terminal cleavage/methylation domain-containing protein [Candidatus Saccharibacteria bacterium]
MSDGFSMVELLITLFIASMLVLAGYGVYDAVLRNSRDSRLLAEASNIAYSLLRKYAAEKTLDCPKSSFASQSLEDGERAQAAKLPQGGVEIKCGVPPENNYLESGVAVLQATVTYDGGRKAEHAIYIPRTH